MVTKHILETMFVGSIFPVIIIFDGIPRENDSFAKRQNSCIFSRFYFNTCATCVQ